MTEILCAVDDPNVEEIIYNAVNSNLYIAIMIINSNYVGVHII